MMHKPLPQLMRDQRPLIFCYDHYASTCRHIWNCLCYLPCALLQICNSVCSRVIIAVYSLLPLGINRDGNSRAVCTHLRRLQAISSIVNGQSALLGQIDDHDSRDSQTELIGLRRKPVGACGILDNRVV